MGSSGEASGLRRDCQLYSCRCLDSLRHCLCSAPASKLAYRDLLPCDRIRKLGLLRCMGDRYAT